MSLSEKEKTIRKGKHAEQLMNDVVLNSAIDEMKKSCYANIENSRGDQKDIREDMYYMLRSISKFQYILKKFLWHGKAASSELEPENLRRIIR